jgi:hypothetical protein
MFSRTSPFVIRATGFSLIELLIAIVLSTLILISLTTVFLAVEKNYQTQLALNSIQENARIVTNIFNSEIHQSGYLGCAKRVIDFPFENNSTQPFAKLSVLQDEKIKQDSQGFTVMYADSQHVNLLGTMQSHFSLHVPAAEDFLQNEIVVISDCGSVDIFHISSTDKAAGLQKISAINPLLKSYSADAEVARLIKNSYFIEKTNRKSPRKSPIYALIMKDINGVKHEMMEGVDDMKISFTIIVDNKLIEKNAAEVLETDNIKGVAITLLLSSVGKIYLQKKYHFYAALRQ